MLNHIPNVLNPGQLAEVRRLMGEVPWVDGRHSSGDAASTVKNNAEISQQDPRTQRLGEIVVAAIMSSPAFTSQALPMKIVPPNFSRYEPGQAYGAHVDAGVMQFQMQGQNVLVRTDLAATLFLSSPDEYDGGELTIEDTFGISRVKLAAGDMVLYPASSLHKVEPITRGRRLVSFFWIQSMVRGDFERGVLRDIDVVANQIERIAPGSAGVKLLSIYHNLLRVWSETS